MHLKKCFKRNVVISELRGTKKVFQKRVIIVDDDQFCTCISKTWELLKQELINLGPCKPVVAGSNPAGGSILS